MKMPSVLCKTYGMFVLYEAKVLKNKEGKCPLCKGTNFFTRSDWIECANDNCDFAALKSHVDNLKEREINLYIGAGI
jgi:phage FluMu protein Com